jgi:hypothetical protein
MSLLHGVRRLVISLSLHFTQRGWSSGRAEDSFPRGALFESIHTEVFVDFAVPAGKWLDSSFQILFYSFIH